MEREININVGENQKLAIKRLNGQIIFVDVSRVHGFCASISRFESVFRSSIISATGLSSFREILYSSDFVQRPACHSDPVQWIARQPSEECRTDFPRGQIIHLLHCVLIHLLHCVLKNLDS